MVWLMTNPLRRLLAPTAIARRLGILLTLLVLGSGCSSTRYRADSLPLEFSAPPPTNFDDVNLARFNASSGDSEHIEWGDLLEVRIDTGLSAIRPTMTKIRVAKDGTVNVPLVGPVDVDGLEVDWAEQQIAEAARVRLIYPNAYVSVVIAEPRKNRISVGGAVKRPGTYELPRSSSSLAAALNKAWGLDSTAGVEIEIKRGARSLNAPGSLQTGSRGAAGSQDVQLASYESVRPTGGEVVHINLLTPMEGDDSRFQLGDGDVVNVSKRPTQPIFVSGLVKRPKDYELPTDRELTLLGAVSMAGGISNQVADKVLILRQVEGQVEPAQIWASLRQARRGQGNLVLQSGDIIEIERTPATAIVEVLKNFVRLGVSAPLQTFF